jgi:hypothetical protein
MKIALALLCASCAAPIHARAPALAREPPIEEELPRSDGVTNLIEWHAPGEGRPLTETRRFDLDALPHTSWGGPIGTRFDVFTVRIGSNVSFQVVVHGVTFAELDVLGARPEDDFAAFTGPFFRGDPPSCGPGKGTRAARWAGLHRLGWTDDGVNVELGRGTLDLVTCRTTGDAAVRARAGAIVPGYVYALRVADKGHESLWVFMPRGTLVSAGGDPRSPLQTSNTGAFTRVTLPLEENSATSATVRVSPASLASWNRVRRGGASVDVVDPTTPSQSMLVSLDVVRQRELTTATIAFALPMESRRSDYAGLL